MSGWLPWGLSMTVLEWRFLNSRSILNNPLWVISDRFVGDFNGDLILFVIFVWPFLFIRMIRMIGAWLQRLAAIACLSRTANKAYHTKQGEKDEIVIYNSRLELVLQVTVSSPLLWSTICVPSDALLDALTFCSIWFSGLTSKKKNQWFKIRNLYRERYFMGYHDGYTISGTREIFLCWWFANFFFAALSFCFLFNKTIWSRRIYATIILTIKVISLVYGETDSK